MIKNSYNYKKKKLKTKKVPLTIRKVALLNIKCSSNNTIIYCQYANKGGLNLSAGTTGLSGAKRSTVYAAQQIILLLIEKLKEQKIKNVIVFFKGFGRGRKSIIKGLKKNKIKVLRIFDITSIAHNGCRVSKKRRL
jgi:small subunit ribosomal protein S11